MTPLEKELVEALEKVVQTHCWNWGGERSLMQSFGDALERARSLLARAKQTGPHEFTVTDDGHGRAMVGGRRLEKDGVGRMCAAPYSCRPWDIPVGTRVRVELRDGVDFATLIEVVP